MRFLRTAFAALACAVFASAPLAAFAQTNYTTNIVLSHLLTSQGLTTEAPAPYATVCASPSDIYGNPIAISASTWGLIAKNTNFCGAVVSGAISAGINVPDAAHTYSATPIYYNITIQITSSTGTPIGQATVLTAVPNITTATYDLDNYSPTVSGAIVPSGVLVNGVSIPGICTAPSLFIRNSDASLWVCNAGTYVEVTGGGGGGASTPATTNVLKGNGTVNGVVPATPGTDYVAPSGTVANATAIDGVTVSGTPSAGQVPTATGPSAAAWATPSAGGSLSTGVSINAMSAGNPYVDSVVSPQPDTLIELGDSIMANYGASVTANGLGSLLGSDLGLCPSCTQNHSIAGSNAYDLAFQALSYLLPSDTGNPLVALTESGNDQLQGSAGLADFARAYALAEIVGATPPEGRTQLNSSQIAFTGTYSTDTTWVNYPMKTCSSGTCTATFSNAAIGPSGSFYLSYQTHSTGANISVTVDGAAATDTLTTLSSIPTAWAYPPYSVGATSAAAARFAGYSNSTSHTIVVTFPAGTTIGPFFLPTTKRTRGPMMIMSGTAPQPSWNPANVTLYNNAGLALWKVLYSDGFYIRWFDMLNATDVVCDWEHPSNPAPINTPTAGCPSSSLQNHPNDLGHRALANLLEAVLGVSRLPKSPYIFGNLTVAGTSGISVLNGSIDLGQTGNALCLWDGGAACTTGNPSANQVGANSGPGLSYAIFAPGGFTATTGTGGNFFHSSPGAGTTLPGPLTIVGSGTTTLPGALIVGGNLTMNGNNVLSIYSGMSMTAAAGGMFQLMNSNSGGGFEFNNGSTNYATFGPTSSSITGTFNAGTAFSVAGTAGYSGNKTAGSCSLVIAGGIITGVTGC